MTDERKITDERTVSGDSRASGEGTVTDYLTVSEAAAYLRISVRKVYDLASRSGLPHRRAGARLLFERTALAGWVRSSGRREDMALPPLVLAGSHDALMEWAVRASRSTLATLSRGSRDGLERVLRREACAALLHLPGGSVASGMTGPGGRSRDGAGDFNVDAVRQRFKGHDVALVNWCWRQQGLIVARGNPRNIRSLADLLDSASRGRPKVGRRSVGAGSRELFDRLMNGLHPGPQIDFAVDDLQSENDAAICVQHGRVDAVLGAQSAAQSFGLGFVPIIRERVDLLVNRRSYFEPPLQALLRFCLSPEFAEYAAELGGYELAANGAVVWNAT